MIILDTNVISELMKEQSDSQVKQWIGSQKPKDLALTPIGIAEITRGLSCLPKGIRRDILEQNFTAFVHDAFGGRIFPFDEEAALFYGGLSATREQAGMTADPVFLVIASIAKNHNASIATRNIKDFTGCAITLSNPWEKCNSGKN
jgi:predicted nucleic acid-binding protein